MNQPLVRLGGIVGLVSLLAFAPGVAAQPAEPPNFAAVVAAGDLPPMAERIPNPPAVFRCQRTDCSIGRYGGQLRMLMSQPKDTRMMVVYGYARLAGYTDDWQLKPDLLRDITVEGNRIFTLHLRRNHRWSDGKPFTADDFRFYWEDVANQPQLSPGGPPAFLLVNGRPPRVEFPDALTVRYAWDEPNPFFLPALAGARPEYIYLPAHYLKAFHEKYTDRAALAVAVAAEKARNWAALFTQKSQMYRDDNPALPTLDPWRVSTAPPASRFIFVRNPYFHRIDERGQQLPYIDEVAMTIVSAALIPAKTASGDADLQARGLAFENYTVLKQGAKRNNFSVRLWRSARGSELALFPNLTTTDPMWRALLRDARFRRALSLGINRQEINQVIYYGLAVPGNDTVLPESPLFRPVYADSFAAFDPATANRLLDEIGLTRRGGDGVRLGPYGRRLQIVVETAGEDPSQVDVLQLVRDTWRSIGIDLFIKAEQRELMRNRAFAGTSVMTVWTGLENALATAAMSPQELAPSSQQQLSWPKWGQYVESAGRSGEPVDLPEAQELTALNTAWARTALATEQQQIWQRMLAIRADQAFSIGTVRSVPQPVVVSNRLHNVPSQGLYNWEPGAYFGIYHPDTFWMEADAEPAAAEPEPATGE
jgi:peptide/nickel transport system substrate-binding protein